MHLDHKHENWNCQVLYIIVLRRFYFKLHNQTIHFFFLRGLILLKHFTHLIWIKNNDCIVKKNKIFTFWSSLDLICILGHFGFIFIPMTKIFCMVTKGIISFKMTPYMPVSNENFFLKILGVVIEEILCKRGEGTKLFQRLLFL